jgi:glycosyltransferase involved in cell wall biosynthesis
MNILALTHGDGENRTFQKLMTSLKKGGDNVEVIAWDRLGKFSDFVAEDGISYSFIVHGGGYRNRSLAICYPLWMIKLFLYLLVKRPQTDMVWAANFETAFPAACAGLFTRKPFIYYIHDNLCLTYSYPIITSALFKWLDKWTIKQASVILVPDVSRIEEMAMPYKDKFHIFPNTPSLAMAPSHLIENENGQDTLYDLYVNGTLWETRGIQTLLKAIAMVPDCRVLVAGNAPEEHIEKAIVALPPIDYRGRVEHSEALFLYSQAKAVFAFYDPSIPINVYASPTKLYESMLMAKPIVINSEARISENVKEWGVGYDCSYDDANSLASIIRSIKECPDSARQKGQTARKLFETRFAWEQLEPKLLKIVRSVE